MKLLIVSTVLSTLILHLKAENAMSQAVSTCTPESGVNQAVLQKTKKGIFENDPKLKMFYSCVFKKLGVMDSAGKLLPAAVKASLPKEAKPEEVQKIMNTCLKKRGNADETAYQFYKCYWNATPHHVNLV